MSTIIRKTLTGTHIEYKRPSVKHRAAHKGRVTIRANVHSVSLWGKGEKPAYLSA